MTNPNKTIIMNQPELDGFHGVKHMQSSNDLFWFLLLVFEKKWRDCFTDHTPTLKTSF